VEALLQIHSRFYSPRIKLRAFPLSAVTLSLRITCQDVCVQQPHAAKHLLLYHYLKWTFDDLLPCYCYALKNNDETICLPVSQHVSAGKRADMSDQRAQTGQLPPRNFQKRVYLLGIATSYIISPRKCQPIRTLNKWIASSSLQDTKTVNLDWHLHSVSNARIKSIRRN